MLDTKIYKDKLEAEKQILLTELESLGIQNGEVTQDWVALAPDTEVGDADENIVADKAEAFANRTAIVADLETRYNNIKLALSKIENNTFGLCEICGEVIEVDRLEANSASRTCKIHINDESELTK
ncbi:hypothetical protein KC845_00080 [Candidatus Kaiserbacteria bacterium]|nr:hypothetical protein [Candidatus Kaiserbacteria bacterium]